MICIQNQQTPPWEIVHIWVRWRVWLEPGVQEMVAKGVQRWAKVRHWWPYWFENMSFDMAFVFCTSESHPVIASLPREIEICFLFLWWPFLPLEWLCGSGVSVHTAVDAVVKGQATCVIIALPLGLWGALLHSLLRFWPRLFFFGLIPFLSKW